MFLVCPAHEQQLSQEMCTYIKVKPPHTPKTSLKLVVYKVQRTFGAMSECTFQSPHTVRSIRLSRLEHFWKVLECATSTAPIHHITPTARAFQLVDKYSILCHISATRADVTPNTKS